MTARLLIAGWFVIALFVSLFGVLAHLPLPPPILAFLLAAIFLMLVWGVPSLRHGLTGAEHLKLLVGFHLIRLVAGGYFLILFQQGLLPGEFAVPAGWGDIAVAVGAMLVLKFCLPLTTRRQRIGLLAWNVVGLLDILSVLANAARLLLDDPTAGRLFTQLPLALLPTFVVPLVIATHLLIFYTTRASGRAEMVTPLPG